MCGRFRLDPGISPPRQILGTGAPEVQARFNIAPTQPVLVIRIRPGSKERESTHMVWGLIPSWAKDPSIGNRMINARAETAAEKPSFRSALRYRRCLIPASGFYEWQTIPGRKAKQPLHIFPAAGGLLAFAGLWEHWSGPNGEEIDSCTILTTAANATMRPFHERMPVIVPEETHDLWLDPSIQDAASVAHLLVPAPDDLLIVQAVSNHVNSPRNDGPQCILPLE